MLMSTSTAGLPAGMAFNRPIAIRKAADAAALPAVVQFEIDTALDNGASTIILVLVDAGSGEPQRTTNAVGSAATKTGVHAFKSAATLGLPRPKLLVLPGSRRRRSRRQTQSLPRPSWSPTTCAPSSTSMGHDHRRRQAGCPADRRLQRVCISDGPILKSDDGVTVAHPSSTAFAAVQSMLDTNRSPAWPHTNVLLEGVTGVSLPVEYGPRPAN